MPIVLPMTLRSDDDITIKLESAEFVWLNRSSGIAGVEVKISRARLPPPDGPHPNELYGNWTTNGVGLVGPDGGFWLAEPNIHAEKVMKILIDDIEREMERRGA